MNGILIMAHAPLAHALRQCALHVFPDAERCVVALDVPPHEPPEATEARARLALLELAADVDAAVSEGMGVLVLTDVFGATPCNVAQRVVDGVQQRLVTGVNLPMLLRSVSYAQQPLDELVTRALSGGGQGIMPVSIAAPQYQNPRSHPVHHDQARHHHQQ